MIISQPPSPRSPRKIPNSNETDKLKVKRFEQKKTKSTNTRDK
jgi:hypothetical protein